MYVQWKNNCFQTVTIQVQYNITFCFICRRNASDSDDEIKSDIKRCTELVNRSIIEHSAYIRACAENKKLNLDKHKKDINDEMKSKNKSKGKKCRQTDDTDNGKID